MKTIPVIAVSDRIPTEAYYCYQGFHDSLAKFGHEATILGAGKPYTGMMSRLKLPLAYMRTISDEHVILCDCWDLLFLASPLDIVEQFEAKNTPIVISAERTLFPALDYGEYPVGDTDCRYLNAGFIVARREALIEMLELIGTESMPDDHQREDGSWQHYSEQELLHKIFCKYPWSMRLDYGSQLCQNMYKTHPGEVMMTHSGIVNTIYDTKPMAIHWNGPAKTEATLRPADVMAWMRRLA